MEVSAINNAGIQSPAGPVSAGVALVDPAWIPELKIINSNVLSWNSVSGKTYQVWSTTNLFIPFSALGSPINALGPMASYTNSPATGTRYFRVQFIP